MKHYSIISGLASAFILAACGGGESSSTSDINTCSITVSDSLPGLFAAGRIRSQNNCSTYQAISKVRMADDGSDISIDYMVHTPSTPAKALVVLIAGGNGDAKIEGGNGIGQQATSASGNFLVRSAHLFAAKGYKLVTVDRPSDHSASSNDQYDLYRQSVHHAVDLSKLINAENSGHLPVVIAGTSRGAISAIPQHKLADAISLSSPVTTGPDGHAVNEASTTVNLRPSSVTVPAHVMWHTADQCGVSTPAGSQTLAGNFDPSAAISSPAGGFNADDFDVCGGSSFHGFYGMEVSAVNATALWIDSRSFPSSKPVVNSGNLTYATVTGVGGEDISGFATAAAGGDLTFSLPFAATTLGGSVTLNGTNIEYTPPGGGTSGKTDSFVYVVAEAGGGTSHNVLNINIP